MCIRDSKHFVPQRIKNLSMGRGKQLVAGLVVGLRTMQSRRGGMMGFASLDDQSGRIEISMFSDVFESNKHKIFKDALVVVQGDVQGDEYSGELKIRVNEVFTIDEARARFAQCIELRFCEATLTDPQQQLESLKALLAPHRSPVPVDGSSVLQIRVNLEIDVSDVRAQTQSFWGATGSVELPEEWSLKPTDELLSSLRAELGQDRASFCY